LFFKKIGKTELEDLDYRAFPWVTLHADGTFRGMTFLGFWRTVAKDNTFCSGFLTPLLRVAAMMGSIPAGESIDEVTFSSTGGTMQKNRASLGVSRIEQITVIRMFIRRQKWDPMGFARFLIEMKEKRDQQRDRFGDEPESDE
jgi:hypothetical protein